MRPGAEEVAADAGGGPARDACGTRRAMPRNRSRCAVAVVLVIGLGLLWRSGLLGLPGFLTKYGGDALWALMVFFGLGLLLPRVSTARLAAMAVGVAWTVEFLQLYRAPWLDAVRSTLLGRLALGTTFNAPDLVAYLVGIVLGAIAERLNRRGWAWRSCESITSS